MNKKILGVLGGLVVVIIGIVIGYNLSHRGQNLGAGVTNSIQTYYSGGITMGGPRQTFDNWAGDKILPKTNIGFFKNTTGGVLYADYVEASTDGFASSTYKIFAYSTTTSPTAAKIYDWTAPLNLASTSIAINGFKFASTSAATTTTSYDLPFAGRTVRIPNNSYLIFQLVGVDTGCASSGGVCETATSSNRGFNIQWRVHYHD